MTTILVLIAVVGAGALVIRFVVLAWPSKRPRTQFHSGHELSVSWGLITVNCDYRVEWGDDRWHVTIIRVEDKTKDTPKDAEFLSRLVAYTLRGGKKRALFIAGKHVLTDTTWPDAPKRTTDPRTEPTTPGEQG
jgi:hypothetical protein